MARYRGDAWLGSNSGRQTVEVSANTLVGAREQISRIYGCKESDIYNLHEVRGGLFSSGSDDFEFSGITVVLGVAFLLWVMVKYWYIIVAIIALTGIVVWFASKEE